MKKYYILLIGVIIFLGLSAFSPPVSDAGNMEAQVPACLQIEENTELVFSKPSYLILDLAEGHDIILGAYRDPIFHKEVLAFFQNLTGSLNVAEAILSCASSLDISPALAFALCAEESNYNPRAFNRNKNDTVDRGLFQLNSASFPKLKDEDFYALDVNVYHGLLHLRWCLHAAGTEVSGLAMYNAGATRVRSSGAPKSTLDYISRILNRQRKIEEQFIVEYVRMAEERYMKTENGGENKKSPFRLSLLTPLGGR